MINRLSFLFLLLCTLCWVGVVAQPSTEQQERKEQKERQKAQKKKIRQEIRYYESLRNESVVKFAREHPPTEISTPFGTYFRVSDVVCAGDQVTGTVMLHFTITPLRGNIRLFMGGERNGTEAFAGKHHYPSIDLYGRIYTLRAGQPEQIIISFNNVPAGTDRFDRIEVSMGLALNLMNMISMRGVPIIWTYSDQTISSYIRATENKAN